MQASVSVKNVGARAGDEVVQLYLHPLEAKRPRAGKELRGIERLSLQPGETKRVSFTLKPSQDLKYYDTDRKAYSVDPGKYEVQVGASSADIRVSKSLVVQ